MIKFITRLMLTILPILYIILIWHQSANFNPSLYEHYWTNSYIFLIFGATLELAHLIEFGILYFLIILAFLSFGKLTTTKEIFALVFSLLYAASDEIHQYFVPYRSFSIIDMVKNTIGIWVVWYLVRRRYYSQKPTKFGNFLRGITTFSKKSVNL
ncbi:VanZ family protein [Bacillus pinisoli]|uniref:VanZ family protein n=1 Tax=Bacillus pinisoli TaxID=2901866 RepID=UPI001FF3F5C9|nr:VanZ family protein [Bacillus pinisoli]